MKILLDTIIGYATAPSTTETALTLVSGDSVNVRNAARCFVLPPMFLSQGAGIGRVRGASMHDPTTGLMAHHLTGAEFNLTPFRPSFVGARDTLVISNSGSATGGDFEVMATPMLYLDADGLPAGNYISPMALQARRNGKIATATATLTASTTACIGGATLLSAFTHNIRGGANYAIVGLITSVAQCCITIKGPCTGNVRIAVPGVAANRQDTSRYFIDLSNAIMGEIAPGNGLIPVINTNDFSSTTIECANNENAASPIVDIFLEELSI